MRFTSSRRPRQPVASFPWLLENTLEPCSCPSSERTACRQSLSVAARNRPGEQYGQRSYRFVPSPLSSPSSPSPALPAIITYVPHFRNSPLIFITGYWFYNSLTAGYFYDYNQVGAPLHFACARPQVATRHQRVTGHRTNKPATLLSAFCNSNPATFVQQLAPAISFFYLNVT